METNSKRLLVTLTCLALLSLLWGTLQAAPLPPLLVVNHDTKQCAEIFGGDECMDCHPPEGWETLGFASEHECPADYAFVEDIEYTCRGFKNRFCCSEGHSGAAGDCEDLVVNHRNDQCAFVDDITDCQLPSRWERRPNSRETYNWTCPAGYDWVDDVDCSREPGDDDAAATEEADDGDGSQTGGLGDDDVNTIIVGFVVALVLIVLVFVLWSVASRKLRR